MLRPERIEEEERCREEEGRTDDTQRRDRSWQGTLDGDCSILPKKRMPDNVRQSRITPNTKTPTKCRRRRQKLEGDPSSSNAETKRPKTTHLKNV